MFVVNYLNKYGFKKINKLNNILNLDPELNSNMKVLSCKFELTIIDNQFYMQIASK